jgi:carboxymethylenebutenolidase
MERRLILVCLLFSSLAAHGQEGITMCRPGMHDQFLAMASSTGFVADHPLPRRYTHKSVQGGEMISFKCPDGTTASGYVIKSKQKSDKWIFVFQEWWGLNDNIKRQSEELYTSLGNINVIALDMYDGKVANDRENALKLVQAFRQERGDMIVKGALDHAGKKARVGTIGWCFGGSQSLMASLTAGSQAAGCVIYYGTPVDDVEKLKTLKTDVLGIFGTKDKHITPEVVTKFEANMKAAGKNLKVMNFDADHGFANPSNPIFDKDATEKAYIATVDFFRKRL